MSHYNATTGTVFDIQRFSLNDGPGIRSVVFLKGCPLRCPWCSNPESQEVKPQPLFHADRCLSCGACLQACPNHAIGRAADGSRQLLKASCAGCGTCAEVCVSEAVRLSGKPMTARQVVDAVLKDDLVYRDSGGGVTLSGGEPLMQGSFATELLHLFHLHGLHTAVETTGFVSREILEQALPHIDLFLYDIKHMDPATHKQVIGVSNTEILQNLMWLREQNAQVILRHPLIPGFNQSSSHLEQVCRLAEQLEINDLHILPYHIYGEGKYALLDRPYTMDVPALTDAEVEALLAETDLHGRTIRLHG